MAERRTLTCRIGGGKPFPVEWIPNETVEEFIDRMHLQANVGPACAVIDSRGWQLRETFVLRNGMALELRTSSHWYGTFCGALVKFGYAAAGSAALGIYPGWLIHRRANEPFPVGMLVLPGVILLMTWAAQLAPPAYSMRVRRFITWPLRRLRLMNDPAERRVPEVRRLRDPEAPPHIEARVEGEAHQQVPPEAVPQPQAGVGAQR